MRRTARSRLKQLLFGLTTTACADECRPHIACLCGFGSQIRVQQKKPLPQGNGSPQFCLNLPVQPVTRGPGSRIRPAADTKALYTGRQVSWLTVIPSARLPGFPVTYAQTKPYTVTSSHRPFTCFPIIRSLCSGTCRFVFSWNPLTLPQSRCPCKPCHHSSGSGRKPAAF